MQFTSSGKKNALADLMPFEEKAPIQCLLHIANNKTRRSTMEVVGEDIMVERIGDYCPVLQSYYDQ
jgi:hypothetical protein